MQQPERINADPLARSVLNALSAHIAILDREGIILETNRAWRDYAIRNGMEEDADCIGINYLGLCDMTTGPEEEQAQQVAAGIRSVISGEEEIFLYDYPCHSPDGRHWYYMRVVRMLEKGEASVVVSHEEITALKLAEEKIREREAELKEQKQYLEEANIALKVLLRQRETDRKDLETRILSNIRDLVTPYVSKLKDARLKARERAFIEIIETHLNDIISPFLQHLSDSRLFLTPQEMQVADLVREGKTSQDIADILGVAETTVHFHRKNLRKKFGLKNRRTNLRSYLLSLTQGRDSEAEAPAVPPAGGDGERE